MIYLIIRLRTTDYARWKETFDTHLAARQTGGATKEALIMQNIDDQNEINMLLGWQTIGVDSLSNSKN